MNPDKSILPDGSPDYQPTSDKMSAVGLISAPSSNGRHEAPDLSAASTADSDTPPADRKAAFARNLEKYRESDLGKRPIPQAIPTREAARRYMDRGWSPIPLRFRDKKPVEDEWQKQPSLTPETFDRKFPPQSPRNVGVRTGEVSGGLVDVDLDRPEAVVAADWLLPPTKSVFGRSGAEESHRLYQVDSPKRPLKLIDPTLPDGDRRAVIVELRAGGQQTMFPPSIHPNGETLAWTTEGDPARVSCDDLVRKVYEVGAVVLLAKFWKRGVRQSAAGALTGGLIRMGWERSRVETFVASVADVALDEEYEEKREGFVDDTLDKGDDEKTTGWPTLVALLGEHGQVVVDKVREWLGDDRKPSTEDGQPIHESVTDPHRLARSCIEKLSAHGDGLALRFWNGSWWFWEGGRYREVPERDVRARVSLLVRTEFERCYPETVTATQKAYDQKEKEAKSRGKTLPPFEPPKIWPVSVHLVSDVLEAMRGLALLPGRTELNSWISADGTVSRPKLIAVANGLLDLDALLDGRPDVLRPHSTAWFSSSGLPYQYDPSAACPKWDAFLKRNLAGDGQVIALLQEWFGYCLTADTSLQRFMLYEGEGGTGKSTACNVQGAVLGEENVSHVPLENFGERFTLTQTLGRLANIAPENGDLDRRAEGVLKAFTSGDRMTFDRKGLPLIEAVPTARLVVAVNNRPRFSDRSSGIWRRMLLIRFGVEIPEAERVVGMDKPEWWRQAGELSGILNWSVEGLRRLRERGRFTVSEACQVEVERLREESNPARLFLTTFYAHAAGEEVHVKTDELFQHYREWAQDNGFIPLAINRFGGEVVRCFPHLRQAQAEDKDRRATRKYGQRGARYTGYPNLVRRADDDEPDDGLAEGPSSPVGAQGSA